MTGNPLKEQAPEAAEQTAPDNGNPRGGWRPSKVLVIVGAIVLAAVSPWVLGACLLGASALHGSIDEYVHRDKASFSSEGWKAGDAKERYSYLEVLLGSTLLDDQDVGGVERLLGQPDRIEDDSSWHYETKPPGFRFIDFSGGGIAVHFNDESKVVDVEDTRWID